MTLTIRAIDLPLLQNSEVSDHQNKLWIIWCGSCSTLLISNIMSPPTHFSLFWSKSKSKYNNVLKSTCYFPLMQFYLTYFSVNKVPANEKNMPYIEGILLRTEKSGKMLSAFFGKPSLKSATHFLNSFCSYFLHLDISTKSNYLY